MNASEGVSEGLSGQYSERRSVGVCARRSGESWDSGQKLHHPPIGRCKSYSISQTGKRTFRICLHSKSIEGKFCFWMSRPPTMSPNAVET